ncbi:MAG TPA: argininosuccinate lyase, partial [Thalassobaculum sp.]
MGMRMWLGSLAVVAGLSMPAVAWGQGKQDFTLINKTGYALSELYVSPNDEEDWQEDVLGKDILDDGQSVDIAFDRSSKACHWDLMVVYEDDGSSAVWRKIDLCKVARITIKYNRNTDTSSATF